MKYDGIRIVAPCDVRESLATHYGIACFGGAAGGGGGGGAGGTLGLDPSTLASLQGSIPLLPGQTSMPMGQGNNKQAQIRAIMQGLQKMMAPGGGGQPGQAAPSGASAMPQGAQQSPTQGAMPLQAAQMGGSRM